MAMNRMQFQPGLSLPAFLRQYGSEAACERALMRSRWPNGFVCPRCQGQAHSAFARGDRQFWQCRACWSLRPAARLGQSGVCAMCRCSVAET